VEVEVEVEVDQYGGRWVMEDFVVEAYIEIRSL